MLDSDCSQQNALGSKSWMDSCSCGCVCCSCAFLCVDSCGTLQNSGVGIMHFKWTICHIPLSRFKWTTPLSKNVQVNLSFGHRGLEDFGICFLLVQSYMPWWLRGVGNSRQALVSKSWRRDGFNFCANLCRLYHGSSKLRLSGQVYMSPVCLFVVHTHN